MAEGGPGGFEAGRAQIKVLANTKLFGPALKKYLERIEKQVVVSLPTRLDTKGAEADTLALVRRLSSLSATVNVDAEPSAATVEHLEQLTRDREVKISPQVDASAAARVKAVLANLSGSLSGLNGFKPAALVTGLAAATYAAGNLAAALAPATGALLLLPALGLAGSAALATLVIGLQGVGDAFKALAEGDPQKLNEALKSLAPNARAAVLEIKRLGPEFSALKRTVQENLFEDVAANINELATVYLPKLRLQLGGIASAFSAAFTQTSGALLEPDTVQQIDSALGDVRASLENLQGLGYSLVKAFAPLLEIGAGFLPGLASGLQDGADRLASFVDQARQTGQLQGWLSAGLSALGDLARIAGNAASAIFSIVSAAQQVGGGSLAALEKVTGALSGFLSSAAGQGALGQVFGGVAAGLDQLLSALAPVGDLFVILAPLIGTIGRQLGTVLGAALRALTPVVLTLAPVLADVLGQVAESLGTALVAAIQLAAPLLLKLAQALAANRPLLIAVGVAIAYLVGPIALAAAAVVGLVTLFNRFRPQITDLATQVGGAVAPVFAALGSALAGLGPLLQALGGALAGFATAVLPILQQIAAVFIEQWPQIKATAESVFTSVITIVRSALTIVTQIIRGVTAAITAIWSVFGGTILSVIRIALNLLLGIIRAAFTIVAGLFKAVASILTGDWRGLWEGIKQILRGAWDALVLIVKTGAKLVGTAFGLVITLLTDQAKGFGSLLLGAGKALIQGLIDGIRSKIGAVADVASEVADKVKGFFGGSPVEEGPLLGWNNGGAGKNLVGMLAEGLRDTRAVERAGRDLAAAVNRSVMPVVGSRAPALSVGALGGSGGAAVQFTGPLYVRDEEALMTAAARRLGDALTLVGLDRSLVVAG